MTRFVACTCAALAIGCASEDEPPWFIRGSARLPDCSDAPAFDLSGTWFDNGTVTVTSPGCGEAAGTELPVCGLAWALQQSGSDVEILVDHEYRILGRACGDKLHLEGGWWLTVQDEQGSCDYEDGVEVGIESGGSTLTVEIDQMTGTLHIAESCTAEYEVTFYKSG